MKRTDHLLALVSAAITADKTHYPAALKGLQESYIIDHPRKPGAVSVGVLVSGTEIPLLPWIGQVRSHPLISLQFMSDVSGRQGIAAHIAAGFVGSERVIMQVATNAFTQTLTLQTFLSAQYALTAGDFIELIDAQPLPGLLWDRAASLILESNRLNDRPEFKAETIREYLQSFEGLAVFNSLAGNLLEELQIEAAVHQQAFTIPPALQPLLIRYPPMFLSETAERELVFLYPLRDVTPAELLQLVAAQPFEDDKIWEQLNKTLNEYADASLPGAAGAAWPELLTRLDAPQFSRLVMPVCRSICTLCEEATIKPVIPTELSQSFGPDAIDQQRASQRGHSERRWSLQPTAEPWEYYRLTETGPVEWGSAPDSAMARSEVNKALLEIREFAAGIQSPFEESFALALFVLGDQFVDGNFDEDHLSLLSARLLATGFSADTIQRFWGVAWAGTLFTSMGWSGERVQGMLVLSLADVFGGMGSWNDQYVEGDQENYTQVSQRLFEALQVYFTALISVK